MNSSPRSTARLSTYFLAPVGLADAQAPATMLNTALRGEDPVERVVVELLRHSASASTGTRRTGTWRAVRGSADTVGAPLSDDGVLPSRSGILTTAARVPAADDEVALP